jgi:type VI secretion system secreted protein Hcp
LEVTLMNLVLRTAIATCALGLSCFVTKPASAADAFIKFSEVRGDCAIKGHEGEVSIVSWSWGTSSSAAGHVGGGSGSGKAQIQDLKITKAVDSSSPKFVEALLSGKQMRSGTISVQLPGNASSRFIQINLRDVIVTSVKVTDAGAGSAIPLEEITLSFGWIEYIVTPMDRSGRPGAAVTVKYDVKTNKVN